MADTYEWVAKSKKLFELYRIYKVRDDLKWMFRPDGIGRQRVGRVDLCIGGYGIPEWRENITGTYHRTKRQAMKAAEKRAAIRHFMRMTMRTIKIPDLTNAVWSQEMIGDHRFDVLRVTVNGEMHQVASIDERGNPQFWAAIRGMGQVPLEGANTYEEARAVAVAMLRMR